MERNFLLLDHIDPKLDTPKCSRPRTEVRRWPGWLFLTGREEDIRLATKKLGLSRVRDSASKDGHSASLMVGK